MDILTRVVNNIRYFYHSRRSNVAIKRMHEHLHDSGSSGYKRYAKEALYHLGKCLEIPIK